MPAEKVVRVGVRRTLERGPEATRVAARDKGVLVVGGDDLLQPHRASEPPLRVDVPVDAAREAGRGRGGDADSGVMVDPVLEGPRRHTPVRRGVPRLYP